MVATLASTDNFKYVLLTNVISFISSQTKLLEEFPDEGGVKDPSKRILPFLPGEVQK